MSAMSTPLGRLRVIGWIEGISLLVILFIGMPLRYGMNIPQVVKIVGPIHGVLWIVYLFALVLAWRSEKWKIDVPFFGFVASVLPFGPFVFERWLDRQSLAEATPR